MDERVKLTTRRVRDAPVCGVLVTLKLVAKVGGGAELRVADADVQLMGPQGLYTLLVSQGYEPHELGAAKLDSRGVWHIPVNRLHN